MNNKKTLVTLLLVAGLVGAFVLYRRTTQPTQQKPNVLLLWHTETDKEAVKTLSTIISAFTNVHPGVEIQQEAIPWGTLAAKLAVAILAKEEPDIAHLEPFMVASIVRQDLLLPIDDVIDHATAENKDKIFPGLQDLQLFDKQRYGIAYAAGVSGWAYRKDLLNPINSPPKDWNTFSNCVATLYAKSNSKGLILPGGDPFFMDTFFAELVANNGGVLFDPETGRPMLTNTPVIQALQFLKNLAPYLDKRWPTIKYPEQFTLLGRGEAICVPVTYGRAAKALESAARSASPPLQANPAVFALMPAPSGPSHTGPAVATIDCEPFVIFRRSEQRTGTAGTNSMIARQFLEFFHRRANYLEFVKNVPIHLTPIFQGMVSDPLYTNTAIIADWQQWAQHSHSFLSQQDRVRPIMMPDVSEGGRKLGFLVEFQAEQILTRAMTDVLLKGKTPQEAATDAQQRTERLIQSLGLKRW